MKNTSSKPGLTAMKNTLFLPRCSTPLQSESHSSQESAGNKIGWVHLTYSLFPAGLGDSVIFQGRSHTPTHPTPAAGKGA